MKPVSQKVSDIDWKAAEDELNAQGWSVVPKLLSAPESGSIANMYGDSESRFRSRVVIGRHGFSLGEYRYFVGIRIEDGDSTLQCNVA
jgi:uncharacterized protein